MEKRLVSFLMLAALWFACATQAALAQSAKLAPTAVTGEISVIQEDGPNGGQIRYYLADVGSGYAYNLNIADRKLKDKLKTGQVVTVHGEVLGDELVVSSVDSNSTQVLGDAKAAVGLRRVGVIIVNFLDATVTCSPDSIAATMFPDPAQGSANPSVSDFYMESSYDQVGFDPDTNADGLRDVFGPYTINALSSDACNYYTWASEAEALAAADGVDLSLYQHLVFVLPSSNTCSWWGVANVGCGTQCRAWVARCQHLDIFAHELGHNLGMRHASTDTNNDGVTDSDYGDYSDVMGYSGVGLRHPDAAHKAQMGWLNLDPGTINTITQSGTYSIAPLESDPTVASLPQVLKIAKAGTSDYYYLSYRVKAGYDTSLRTSYPDRLNIHRFPGSGPTYLISTLSDGGVFSDLVTGVSVTQMAHNADPNTGSVTVQVNFGVSAVLAAPTVTMTPSSKTTNSLSSSVVYTLSVKNNDSAGSPSATFALTGSAPSGWLASLSPANLTLAPGATGSATLSVTPPSTAADGTNALNVTASAVSHSSASGAASCTIDTTAPAAPTGLTAQLASKSSVQLSWTAPSGAASYAVYRNTGSGFMLLATTTSISYKDSNTKVTTDTTFSYYVKALDAAGNASGASNTASVLVKASTTGKPR